MTYNKPLQPRPEFTVGHSQNAAVVEKFIMTVGLALWDILLNIKQHGPDYAKHCLPTNFQKRRYSHLAVCRLQKRYNFFKANNLLITKFPRLSSHTSNTVDKLNKSKSSGLENVFTLVLPLVRWLCCCYCLFLQQWMTASLTMVVAVEAVVTRRQRQRRRSRRWTTIGGKSGQQ